MHSQPIFDVLAVSLLSLSLPGKLKPLFQFAAIWGSFRHGVIPPASQEWPRPTNFGNGPSTVSETTASNAEPSEFLGPHRVPSESSVSSSQLKLLFVCQSELTEFFAELAGFGAEIGGSSLPKQHDRNSKVSWEVFFSVVPYPCKFWGVQIHTQTQEADV